MRLLDLFCGAGGASKGYADAGFEVVGVDIKKQRHYPFEFHQADALEWLTENEHEQFDFIHASPPCQRWSKGARRHGTQDNHPDLIEPTRALLDSTGLPYVIENVSGAPLTNTVMLCGTMFDLGVFRHRMFETNWELPQPEHHRHTGRIGDGKYVTVTGHSGGSSSRDGWTNGGSDLWIEAMGIDWMTTREMSQSIPPAYTRFIADVFLNTISVE